MRAHEKVFWRRLAHFGASRGPSWFVRYAPPVVGWTAAALVPSARRAVVRNLRRIRGRVAPFREVREVLATFGTYASCLTEVLANDAPGGPHTPDVVVTGTEFVQAVLGHREARSCAVPPRRPRRGLIIVTAHTAGWESVGALLSRDHGLPLVLVMAAEPDADSRELQDSARKRAGVDIVHVGDPLASLQLLRHLRDGGAVALQLDRSPPGIRTRSVTLLGRPDALPEGPLRLAQLSGAPILPMFCARLGHRKYVIEAFQHLEIARRPTDAELDHAAQSLATAMTTFLRAHPTNWFHFV